MPLVSLPQKIPPPPTHPGPEGSSPLPPASRQTEALASQQAHVSVEGLVPDVLQRLSQAERTPLPPLSWEEALPLLDSIPGVPRRMAEAILAEIGPALSRFPTARHLASWVGRCPGNHESAGKRMSGRTRKGHPSLRQHLVEAAQGATHTKNTYLATLYKRLSFRRGAKKAMVAVGHPILTIVSPLLSRHPSYQDLGANSFDERDRQATQNRSVKGLQRLGFEVTLQSPAQVA